MISLPIILLANALNQYTSRTVPGYASLRGEAATNATVTVNERPTFRQGSFFYGSDSADNTTSNLWKELEIYAAINPPGTNTPDVVYASTGTVFVAKTPESFTYDADGNMTSDGRFHYTWNGENRLVCASNAEVVVTYAYDHRGRMVQKEISHEGTKTRRIEYLWDDWNIIREVVREGDSVAITDNVWGLDLDGTLQGAGGVGGLLAVIRSNSNSDSNSSLYFPTYDANGNVSEYVSTNGEVVAHYDYSPFGEPLVASGPLAATFTHRFSTKPYCAVTGFSEYQMRKYRPEIGRWMSRDPIEEIGGENLYGFCGNSAITTSDIRGQGFWPEKDMCKCNQWLTEEVKDLKWLLSLPNCPCKLAFDKSNRPIRPKGWPSMDNPADQTYHPGARYCIRSSPVGHARQQCCYDEKGALITWGGGAGTPDKESDLFKHKANDVNPYYICGKSWKLYNFARPPNNGNNCAENPLNPPHGPGF